MTTERQGTIATFASRVVPRHFTVTSGRAVLAGVEAGAEEVWGPAVVFLHAGVADRRMWQQQVSAFAETYRVVAYDRRGFGETRYDVERFSHVHDLRALLDDLQIRKAVLVGCSQGGRVAIDYALTHPGRVAGLFLVAPAVSGQPEPTDYPPAVAAVVDLLDEAEADEDVERVNELEAWLWLDGPAREEGRVSGPLRDLFLEMNGIALRAADPGEQNPPSGAPAYRRLGELDLPAQVVWGDADFPHVQQRCNHLVQALPQALGTVIAGTAHLPNLEQPALFNHHLAMFLDGL